MYGASARLLSISWQALPTEHLLNQTRNYKSVVLNGNVTKALRQLSNHTRDEKLLDKWRSAQIYVKPAHKRVLQQKETAKKLKREDFKTMMHWVMQAKSR